MIFNVSGGGGTALNFRVVGGTTAPTNPAENCIWVNTDTPITSWIFSATEPSPAEAGMVWIPTGTSSTVEFDALKKNSIQVYPLSAKQYISGAWVDVVAMSYMNGVWVDWGSIPPIYKEVEYLESTGTQYIKTKCALTSVSKLIIVQKGVTNVDGSGHGVYESNKRFKIAFVGDNASVLQWGMNSKYGVISCNPIANKTETVLDSKNKECSINGTHVSTTESYSGNRECYLFKINTATTAYNNYAKTRLFSAKIYDDDVLVRDFVPCYRKSDNVAGLFDLVTKEFYTNAGTGTFIVG